MICHTLRYVFTKACADIDKANPMFNNTKVLKKFTEYVGEVFNEIGELVRDDWNYDFNAESELQVMKVSADRVIIHGNDRNDIFTIANIVLTNFFCDYSASIHKLKLYECNCRFCGGKYLGAKNSFFCDDKECQKKYQHEKKKENCKAKEKGPYNTHLTKLSNYLSQHTSTLKATVQ